MTIVPLGFEPEYNGWIPYVFRSAEQSGVLPDCLTDSQPCYECELAITGDCPVMFDHETASYLRAVADGAIAKIRIRAQRLIALQALLRRYRRPLHWEHIAQFAIQEYDSLFPSPAVVRQMLVSNPSLFSQLRDGVYELAAPS